MRQMRRTLCSLLCSCALVVIARDRLAAEEPTETLTELIDRHIDNGLRKNWKLEPTEQSSDAEFLRRISLDLTGTIPDSATARAFLIDQSPVKRQELIDQLLASEAFARHFAIVFDVMLMERRPDNYVTTAQWRTWLADSFSENKPLNTLVKEVLESDGVDEENRPAAKFYLDRAVDKDLLVKDIGRLLLGMNLQCAQCHNHPDIDDYVHEYYHGLTAFVAGSKTFKQKDGTFVLQEVALREVEFASVFSPDEPKKTGPRLLDVLMDVPEFPEGEEYVEKPSRTVRSVPKFSLRKLLADRLPTSETKEFSRNLANRLWAMMMGRGLVHPLDMHHAANPPSHPELLSDLTEHLVESGFDMKSILKAIASSSAYQRSSLLAENADPDRFVPEAYAVANLKGLSPEQLFDSLLVAAEAEAVLDAQIEEELREEDAAGSAEEKPSETDDEMRAERRREKRDEILGAFVSVFGSVPGQAAEDSSTSLSQALFLANSTIMAEWVPPESNNLAARLIAVDDPALIAEELYLSTLTRLPTSEEKELVVQAVSGDRDTRSDEITIFIWSLLTSAEFRFNH